MNSWSNYIAHRFRKFARQLPYIMPTVRLVWEAAPAWTAASLGLILIQGLLPVATVYLSRALVNNLVATVGGHGHITLTIGLAACAGGLLILWEALTAIANWVSTVQAELVADHIMGSIHRKSTAVSMEFYDSPDFFNELHRAREDADYRPMMLIESIGGALQNGIGLLSMLAVMAAYGPWIPMALLASTIPALCIVVGYTHRQYNCWMHSTSEIRRAAYYDSVLTQRETAAEVRLFDLGACFQQLYRDMRRGVRAQRLALAKRQAASEVAAGASGVIILGAIFLYVIWKIVQGRMTLGDLAFFYQAISQGTQVVRGLLSSIGKVYANSLFLSSLFGFLSLPSETGAAGAGLPVAPRPGACSVRFHKVNFRYPGTSRFALRDFSLNIEAGQTIAVVGMNGAGKSTLIKLLCRFYEPDSGAVELDGTPLPLMGLAELRQRITVLFQQPVEYNMTAAENIALADVWNPPDQAEVRHAAAQAGADDLISRLPQGYATLLGRWFPGGTGLSTGEWQRIALARAYFGNASVIVLDEPTSAMDPWAEAEWLERFREIAQDKTAIIITHRFTTAMHADIIYVMQDGQLREGGTHDELLASGGLYARAWSRQVMPDFRNQIRQARRKVI